MIGYPNLCPRVTFSSARQVIVEGLISNLMISIFLLTHALHVVRE